MPEDALAPTEATEEPEDFSDVDPRVGGITKPKMSFAKALLISFFR